MCCCCCPPAISAIFCLWVQSGFSKGTVAGALTFFPPDPPLYKFERIGKDGNKLPDTDTADEEENKEKNGKKNNKKKEETKQGDTSESDNTGDGHTTATGNDNNNAEGLELVVTEEGVYQAKEGQTKEIVRSPAQQFTDQAKALRKLGKERNIRDTKDALRGITYRLFLDPRLQPPRFHNGCSVTAVKIPTSSSTTSSTTQSQSQSTDKKKKKKKKSTGKNHNHCAAIVYKVPPVNQDRTSEGKKTMTIIYSHGNATDIGAMYPLQAILSNSLECNVVSYDYSGYGESGGIAMEANTYTDIAGVYAWTLANVCNNDKSRILLYGQSVGSGPCCHLAQKIGVGLGGMILHSPFMSGMRVLTPSRYVYYSLL